MHSGTEAASEGEVEMYEAGGTLVIETPRGDGDLVIDGTRVAATLRSLVARVGAAEAETARLRAALADTVRNSTQVVRHLRLDHAREIKKLTGNGAALEQKVAVLGKNVSVGV